MSYLSRQKFNASNKEGKLDGLYNNTNRLYFASCAVLAVGAGTFTWGAILDGSGNPLPTVRIRF